jgi:hypothetical protein
MIDSTLRRTFRTKQPGKTYRIKISIPCNLSLALVQKENTIKIYLYISKWGRLVAGQRITCPFSFPYVMILFSSIYYYSAVQFIYIIVIYILIDRNSLGGSRSIFLRYDCDKSAGWIPTINPCPCIRIYRPLGIMV